MKLKPPFVSDIMAAIRMYPYPYRPYHRKYRCIFIHIPKTAGTSILHALGRASGMHDHLPWYVYYNANPRRYQAYFSFCFVRNPWDRAYSAYRFFCAGGNGTTDLPMAESILNFASFDHFIVDGLGRGRYRSHPTLLPQSNFVIAYDDKVMVDFIGRYENIEDDFKIIADRLKLTSGLPHKNQSPNSQASWMDAYGSAESIAAIAEIYRQDILIFGYAEAAPIRYREDASRLTRP